MARDTHFACGSFHGDIGGGSLTIMTAAIRTPDQRLRVFVSSTLNEMAEERLAAQAAITQLHLTPVLFELGARPHAPRLLYRAYLEQSDVFIGIYWERYGWIAPDEDISGLEDEYRRAENHPKLIYVKTPAPEREPRLAALLQTVQDDNAASYRRFSTADQLHELIENDLALLLTERFSGTDSPPAPVVQVRSLRDELPVPRDRLVDRTAETALARRLLRDRKVGLVTLTGPGGSGKTRLALHLAARLRDSFVDGVVFVPMASLTLDSQIAPAIARTLGLPASSEPTDPETLTEYLKPRQILLVLDNFEHLLGAAPLVSELLEHCPQLKILVTSRAPLHIRGEHELPVPPLAVPEGPRLATRGQWGQYPAVELFVARAREVQPNFAVTEETAPAIAEICMRLDGLPLAIELAAARIKVLPPREMLARLERRLPVLTGGSRDLPTRQQTLRDTIEWSYKLLSEREQSLFRRLSVFVGGFALDAAKAIWPSGANGAGDGMGSPAAEDCDSDAVLEGIESLLDKNLLWVREAASGDLRFGMLETIREYGLWALAANGEEHEVKSLLSAWSLALAEQAAPELVGANQIVWLERLDAEQANMRAALEWSLSVEESAEMPLRLGAAIWRFWWSRGYARDGQRWLGGALAKPCHDQPIIRARALVAAGELAETRADYQQAEAWYDEALALSASLGDELGQASALNGLGVVLRTKGALDQAEALHDRALAILRRLGSERGVASTLNNLGGIAYVRRDLSHAARLWEESLNLVRTVGDQRSTGALLSNLGALATVQGDTERAIHLHEEALALARSMADREGIALALANLGGALFEHGEQPRALAAYEEALADCRQAGDVGSEAIVLYDLGRIAEAQGDPECAAGRFAESLGIFWKTGSLPAIAAVLEHIGTIAAERGAATQAARLFAAAAGIRVMTGAACDDSAHERHLADTLAAIGEPAFEAAWEAGSTLTIDQAVAEGLACASAISEPTKSPSNSSQPWSAQGAAAL